MNFPHIVVLVPGIMGSVLEKDGREVWGPSAGTVLRAAMSRGGSIRALTLQEDSPDDPDGDGVVATSLARDVQIFPGLWRIDGYTKVAERLRRYLKLESGVTYFDFPYDWRRDNRVAAQQLKRKIAEWLGRRRQVVPQARVVLVAHSMGGLVSRYYIEVLEGWRDTESLITFGTPYRGSLNALDSLCNGVRKLRGLLDLTELSRSLTSIHQLLPIYPCFEVDGRPAVRLKEAEGIPNVDLRRVEAADAFHREIQRAVEANAGLPEYAARRYSIHPIVGIEQPTLQSARLRGQDVELTRARDGEDEGGDGTVPRVSATPIEEGEDRAVYAATRHASLQNADAVLIQVRGILTQPTALGSLMATAPTTLSLDMEDVFLGDEPVRGSVAASDRGEDLKVEITDVETDVVVARQDLPRTDAPWRDFGFPPLSASNYRVRVIGDPDRVEPVTDLFIVT